MWRAAVGCAFCQLLLPLLRKLGQLLLGANTSSALCVAFLALMLPLLLHDKGKSAVMLHIMK